MYSLCKVEDFFVHLYTDHFLFAEVNAVAKSGVS